MGATPNPEIARIMNDLAEEMLDLIKSGEPLQWVKRWKGVFSPTNAASEHTYTGFNVWLCISHMRRNGFESPLYVAPSQAKKLMKAYNEQHGTSLFATPNKSTLTLLRPRGFWVKKKDDEGKETKRFVTQGFVGFKAWNIEETNIPADWAREQMSIESLEPVSVGNIVENLEAHLGVTIELGGGRACYNPRTDVISMPPLDAWEKPSHFITVLLHEAGHATGHRGRLARPLDFNAFSREGYAKEELVAELCAVASAGMLGVEYDLTQSAAYLAGWAKATTHKDAVEAILEAIPAATKAADMVANGFAWNPDLLTPVEGEDMTSTPTVLEVATA